MVEQAPRSFYDGLGVARRNHEPSMRLPANDRRGPVLRARIMAPRDAAVILLAVVSAFGTGTMLATVPEWGFLPVAAAIAGLPLLAIAAWWHVPSVRPSDTGDGLLRYLGTVTVAVGVLLITFTGVRPLVGATLADLFLVTSAGLLTLYLLTKRAQLPRVPVWLIVAACGIVAGGLLSAAFAPPVVFGKGGSSSGEGIIVPVASDFAGDILVMLRFSVTLFFVPVIIGIVSDTSSRVKWMVDVWLASAVLNALVAVGDSFQLIAIGEQLTGIESAPGRAIGLATHSNHLAVLGAIALPVALSRAITAPRALRRRLSWASVVVIGTGVAVSGSRAGLLAGTLGLLLVLFLQRHEFKRIVGGVAVVGAAIVIMASILGTVSPSPLRSGLDRLTGGSQSSFVQRSNAARRLAAERAIDDFVQHPLTGTGLGTVRLGHDLYLQVLQGGGVVLLSAFALFGFGAIRMGHRLSRHPRLTSEMRSLAGALTISLGVWLIGGLVQNPLYDRYLYVPVGLLLGLHFLALRVPPSRDLAFSRPASRYPDRAVGRAW